MIMLSISYIEKVSQQNTTCPFRLVTAYSRGPSRLERYFAGYLHRSQRLRVPCHVPYRARICSRRRYTYLAPVCSTRENGNRRCRYVTRYRTRQVCHYETRIRFRYCTRSVQMTYPSYRYRRVPTYTGYRIRICTNYRPRRLRG